MILWHGMRYRSATWIYLFAWVCGCRYSSWISADLTLFTGSWNRWYCGSWVKRIMYLLYTIQCRVTPNHAICYQWARMDSWTLWFSNGICETDLQSHLIFIIRDFPRTMNDAMAEMRGIKDIRLHQIFLDYLNT